MKGNMQLLVQSLLWFSCFCLFVIKQFILRSIESIVDVFDLRFVLNGLLTIIL